MLSLPLLVSPPTKEILYCLASALSDWEKCDAALAWQQIQKQQTPSSALLKQFNRPEPQVALAQSLLGIANSCIDISVSSTLYRDT
jgi:hypothetical protein